MNYIQAFFMSLGMFSSIPCPYRPWNEKARHLMLVFLPLVGLVIGLLWYGIYLLMDRMGIPLQLQTAVLMLYPYLITGFIHLDGFMDTADATLSGRPLEDKLRILKDPHTGAFAVISVGILFVFCFASMLSAMEQIHFKQALDIDEGDPMLALILIPVLTRCCSAIAVLAGKPLAHSQYNEAGDIPTSSLKRTDVRKISIVEIFLRMRYKEEPGVKKPVAEITAISLMGLTAILAALAIGTGIFVQEAAWSVPLVLAGAVAAYLAAMSGAMHQLKGVSGDLAGYALTIGEAFAIIMLALLS